TVLIPLGSFSIQEEAMPPFFQGKDVPQSLISVFSQTVPSGSMVTLQPGQSLTQTATWFPAAGQAPVGTYNAYFSTGDEWGVLWNGIDQFQVGTPSSIATIFATSQADSDVGQPVEITLTETNTSNAPVTIYAGPLEFQISLLVDFSGDGA